MARLKSPAGPATRGAELSVAWRADSNRAHRRIALVMAGDPGAATFERLARRAIGARFGHLDRRLAGGPPLTQSEVADLARLEALADHHRRSS